MLEFVLKTAIDLFPMPQALGDEKIVAMVEKVELTLLLTCKLEKQFGHQTLE
jgi:hypothetical protein